MNGAHAGLEGMHREEAVARFARFDAPLPYPELDCVRWMVFLLGACVACRRRSAHGNARMAALMAWSGRVAG